MSSHDMSIVSSHDIVRAAITKTITDKMKMDDFFGAQLLALRSKALKTDIANLSQIIAVCQIHVAASETSGNIKNWHHILDVVPEANEAAINFQYKKLSLLLHPDKNKFHGATDAFILISDARRVLLRGVSAKSRDNKKDKASDDDDVVSQTKETFWTGCPICFLKSQYYKNIVNRLIRCNNCKTIFAAIELKGFTLPPKKDLIIPGVTRGGKTEKPRAGSSSKARNSNEDKAAGKRKIEVVDIVDDDEELPKIKMRRGNRTAYL